MKGFRVVNGTPSDCVHVALTGLLAQRPDLVLSGINNGANMGDDTLYSGTVAAAMEGYLFGIPAIAFSQVEKGWGAPRGRGCRGPRRRRPGAGAGAAGAGALAAEREHSQPRRCGSAAAAWSPAWAGAMPASR